MDMIGFTLDDVEAPSHCANPDVAESKEIDIQSMVTNPGFDYSPMPVHVIVISSTKSVGLGLVINSLSSLVS